MSALCDKFTDGDWIESKDQSDSGIRLVQTGNVGVAEYLDKPNNRKWISDVTFEQLHCEEVLPGDILISRLPEPAGRACIMPFLGTKMITAVDCTIVRTASNVSNKFLVQYLSSQAYFDAVNTCLAGGTRQRISRSNLADFDVPIPPEKAEQDAIGSFFSGLDNLITLHQREEKSHTVGPTCIATAWEQRKFDEVISRIGTGLNPRDNFTLNTGGENYYVTIKNFEHGHLFLDENCDKVDDKALQKIQERSDLRVDDILFTSIGRIGDCYLIKKQPKNWNINESVFTLRPNQVLVDPEYIYHTIHSDIVLNQILNGVTGSTFKSIKIGDLKKTDIPVPGKAEQKQIAMFVSNLDNLITLHQREHNHINTEVFMLSEIKANDKFCDYYAQWISVYKEGAVRKVTMDKYKNTHSWLVKLIPELSICELNRVTYQQLLNNYARYHERQTTMDFHHQLKGAIQDAVDDGLIEKDPTRKAIIKGKTASEKKTKYLNQFELHTLLSSLDLKGEINWDWFILLVAKTGMRFSEALALTPKDFDFAHQTLSISKTWDYKGTGGFLPTKNKSSVRKIQIDWQTVIQFSELVRRLPQDEPIFVKKDNVYNSTVNDILERHCKKAGVPVITVHGLRHTHASLLLFAGVSIASVARRLGHASMTTTQKTYLHIIQELENQDVDLVMRSLSGLS